jgi:hypothetical protein
MTLTGILPGAGESVDKIAAPLMAMPRGCTCATNEELGIGVKAPVVASMT